MKALTTIALLLATPPAFAETGIASIYWNDSTTSSGELPNRKLPTVAHRTIPLGTCLHVAALGKVAKVRVNDRGPCAPGGACSRSNAPASHRARERVLDLSEGAAKALGAWKRDPAKRGLVRVYFWRTPCA